MSGLRQGWLVARRELRERSRSRAFIASVAIMILAVIGAIALPAVLRTGGGTKHVGLAGTIPPALPEAIQTQSAAVGREAQIHRYDTLAAAEQAVRDGKIDVLVVDAQQLEWQRHADEQLKAIVTGSIQIVAVQDRAADVGIDPDDLAAVMAPVAVRNVELGQVAGRSPDDETAAFIMTVLLFMSIGTYGAMVLSGVVEEKSSRVVEVLLARVSPRTLLAGKIAGIGLLGLAQIAATALAALLAVTMIDTVDLPAVRGAVLVWAVVWFVLGYTLYASVFGALGSLASRPEDAQSAAGPVSVLLILVYFVSFAAIGSPDTTWARLVSWFPATAPIAMPTRIAMGAAEWWDPLLAVVLTGAAIVGLVLLGGRVYAGAILHTGPTLKLRDAWRHTTTPGTRMAEPHSGSGPGSTPADAAKAGRTRATGPDPTPRAVKAIEIAIAVVVGTATFAISGDFIIAVAAAALVFAATTRILKLRPRPIHGGPTSVDHHDLERGERIQPRR
jgi:ABC-2 type transport system permease protein